MSLLASPAPCIGNPVGGLEMFNTLRYAKRLEDVGFSKEQAETSIEILSEIMEEKLATKEDLQLLKADLTVRMGAMLATSIAILTALIKLI